MTIADEIGRHMPRLRHYALHLTRNPSDWEDLVHDTIVRALERQHLFDGRQPAKWLCTIMHHRHVDLWRTNHVDANAEVPEVPFEAPQEDRVYVREVADRMAALSPKLGVPLMRTALGGTTAEIMEETGAPQPTVLSRIWRARIAMREFAA